MNLGETTLTLTDELFSSLTTEMLNAPMIFTTAPLTVVYNCTGCEQTMDLTNYAQKTQELKQLEDVARDYFTQRVLKIGEGTVTSLTLSEEESKKLLSKVRLCQTCVTEFVQSEKRLLQDQINYLQKLKTSKTLEEVFQDPWLDIKRLAFNSLKYQEDDIRRKLEIINKCQSFGLPSTSSSVAVADNQQNCASTSTATTIVASAITSPLPVVNLPQGQITTEITLVETSGNVPHEDNRHSGDGEIQKTKSVGSSRVGSPKPGSIASCSPYSRGSGIVTEDFEPEASGVNSNPQSVNNGVTKPSSQDIPRENYRIPASPRTPLSKGDSRHRRSMTPVVRLTPLDIDIIKTPRRSVSRASSELREEVDENHVKPVESDNSREKIDSGKKDAKCSDIDIRSSDSEEDDESGLVIDTASDADYTKGTEDSSVGNEDQSQEENVTKRNQSSNGDSKKRRDQHESEDLFAESDKNSEDTSNEVMSTKHAKKNKLKNIRTMKRKRSSAGESSSPKRKSYFEVTSSKQVTPSPNSKFASDTEVPSSSKTAIPFKRPFSRETSSSNVNSKPKSMSLQDQFELCVKGIEGAVFTTKKCSPNTPYQRIVNDFEKMTKSCKPKWQPGKNNDSKSKEAERKVHSKTGKSKKTVFTIGRRLMTETEDSDDSDDDNDGVAAK